MEPGPPKLFWFPGVPVFGVRSPELGDRHFVGLSFTEARPPELFWFPGVPVSGVKASGVTKFPGVPVSGVRVIIWFPGVPVSGVSSPESRSPELSYSGFPESRSPEL